MPEPRKPDDSEALEIERKFLVLRPPPGLEPARAVAVRQGYLAAGNGREVRLRRKDGRFFLTAKAGAGLIREEAEIELTPEQFAVLWPLTLGRRLDKSRYVRALGPHVLEIDVFHGKLEGLILVEVEFRSPQEAEAFEPPPWFGREVTQDERFKNSNLARLGLPRENP